MIVPVAARALVVNDLSVSRRWNPIEDGKPSSVVRRLFFSIRTGHSGPVVPGQERVDLALFVAIDDGCWRGCQSGMRIDPGEFAGFDERGDDDPIFTSRIVSGEECALPVERDRADGALDSIVMER